MHSSWGHADRILSKLLGPLAGRQAAAVIRDRPEIADQKVFMRLTPLPKLSNAFTNTAQLSSRASVRCS